MAGLNVSEPTQRHGNHEKTFIAFVDIHTSSHFMVAERELLMCHIKSNKDYKNLRRLVRRRLISSLRDIQDLVNDSLRNLGVTKI